MGIKPASRKTDSSSAPIDLYGSGFGRMPAAEMTDDEPRIHDLAWAT